MKKLFAILLSVFLVLSVSGQSITDKETYVKIVHSDGTTISIGKNQVESLKIQSSRVYIMTSRKWENDALTRIIYLNPTEFGFSTTAAFHNYLSSIFFNSYNITYSYNAGLVDTVSYFAGDSLAYRIVYSYDGSNVDEKSEPINE